MKIVSLNSEEKELLKEIREECQQCNNEYLLFLRKRKKLEIIQKLEAKNIVKETGTSDHKGPLRFKIYSLI